MFFIVTFYISLLGIITMILLKIISQKRGKAVMHSIFHRGDAVLKRYVNQGKYIYEDMVDKGVTFVNEDLPRHGLSLFESLRQKLNEKYKEYSISARGERVLSQNRETSEFLKKISIEKTREIPIEASVDRQEEDESGSVNTTKV